MTFRIGQEVVCIADTLYVIDDLGFPNFKKGEILTIADFEDDPIYGLFLIFKERDPRNLGHHKGFRPVVKPDISIFTAMLHPVSPEKVTA